MISFPKVQKLLSNAFWLSSSFLLSESEIEQVCQKIRSFLDNPANNPILSAIFLTFLFFNADI
jgi:hypothetical protein